MVAATVQFPEDEERVVLFPACPRIGDRFAALDGRSWRVCEVDFVERHQGHARLLLAVEPWCEVPLQDVPF